LTLGIQVDLTIFTVADDNVKLILKLLGLISIANNINRLLLIRLQDAVALYHFPNRLFALREGSVLGIDLRLVLDFDLVVDILKNLNVAEVKGISVNLDDWADRVSIQLNENRDGVTLKLDPQVDVDRVKDL
jgi:hypothetical protein